MARRAVGEGDERGAVTYRADRERGERPVVAPVEEGARLRLQAPAQAPGDTGGVIFGERLEPLNASVANVDARP
jgi:hypothetical protein